MFNLGSSYFHVALTTVRHLLNVTGAVLYYEGARLEPLHFLKLPQGFRDLFRAFQLLSRASRAIGLGGGTLKMRDMKLRDMKMRHQTARVENARHENAAPECRGGKCET